MFRIIDKINSHKFLNNEDIKIIINETLKELNWYKKNNNVNFIKEVEYMNYTHIDKRININLKYRHMILNSVIGDKLVVSRSKKFNSTFLVDFYNIYLLWNIYHELRHFEQLNILFDNKNKYNNLLKYSDEYLDIDYKFYQRKHSLFLLEHDADIIASFKIYDLLKKLDISENAIYFWNVRLAQYILKSRGYNEFSHELKRENKFHSPFELLKFLTNAYYGIGKEYDEVLCNIMDLRNESKTEYDKLIIGDRLNDDTIDKIFLIAQGKIRTKNIYDYVKNECKKDIKVLKKEI